MRARFGRGGRVVGLMFCLALLAAVGGNSAGPGFPAADTHGTKAFWNQLDQKPAKTKNGHKADVKADRFLPLSLDRAALGTVLGDAPLEHTERRASRRRSSSRSRRRAASSSASRSAGRRSWRPASRRSIPRSRPTAGRGIDDPAATIHADLSPLGFHASVRSPQGAWYIDPYYHLDQSVYASYYGRDVANDAAGRRSSSATPTRPSSRSTRATTTPPTPSRCRGSGFADERDGHDHDLRSRGAASPTAR